MKIKADKIEVGQKVLDKEGKPMLVIEISNGMFRNGLMLYFPKGLWSNVLTTDLIEIEE